MKTTLLSTFAVLSLFAVSPARADVGQAQEAVCSEGHYDATNKAARPCGTTSQQLAEDWDQKRESGGGQA